MHIIFNGTERTVPDQSTVQSLLDHWNISSGKIIFLCNDAVVPPQEYDSRRLAEQDRLEVLNVVGGG